MDDHRMPEDRRSPGGAPSFANLMQRADELDARRQKQLANQVDTINHLKEQFFTSLRLLNEVMHQLDCAELVVTNEAVQENLYAEIIGDEASGVWQITRRDKA